LRGILLSRTVVRLSLDVSAEAAFHLYLSVLTATLHHILSECPTSAAVGYESLLASMWTILESERVLRHRAIYTRLPVAAGGGRFNWSMQHTCNCVGNRCLQMKYQTRTHYTDVQKVWEVKWQRAPLGETLRPRPHRLAPGTRRAHRYWIHANPHRAPALSSYRRPLDEANDLFLRCLVGLL
jgi:hypothetical protein